MQSVGAKVIWIVTLISGAVVLAVSLVSGVYGYQRMSQQMLESISAQASIVAMNSSAPLSFRDEEMAHEALSALQFAEGVQQAILLDDTGMVFSRFSVGDVAGPLPTLHPLGHVDAGDVQSLVIPVGDRAGVHGRLQVDFSDAALRGDMRLLGIQSLLLTGLAMLLAWLLARRLHPLLTAPIVELEMATQRVRATGNYSVRAARISNDELGRLTEEFNAMLERIEGSQKELLEAQLRAEESSRLKDEFVATLSHELRTPLSPIVAWIHMLRLPKAQDQLPKGLDVMERNATALTRIIDDLLDMSRITSGTLRLDPQPVDIDAIIRSAAETLAPAAQARRVTVALALASPRRGMRGDPSRLQQVVWNLLSNAIKFSPDGGQVTIQTLQEGMHMDIVISDNGTGIDQAFLPYVFDRFRQQDGSITRSHGGLGLGRSIVRQLVELHGGSVRAASPGRGRGATFVVSLPLAGESLAAQPPAHALAPTRALGLQGVAVLVVEDEQDMRAIVCLALEGAGARVHAAASADEALQLYRRSRPDVIVSDIGLPDLDGYALLRQLRQIDPGVVVPAIALTAYARPEEQRRAREAGFQVHMSKPFEPAELVAEVAQVAAHTAADTETPRELRSVPSGRAV